MRGKKRPDRQPKPQNSWHGRQEDCPTACPIHPAHANRNWSHATLPHENGQWLPDISRKYRPDPSGTASPRAQYCRRQARDRQSVVKGTSGVVSVDLGGGRIIKKKTSD